jgi:hypothetical protein
MSPHLALDRAFDEIDALSGGVSQGLLRGHAVTQPLRRIQKLPMVCVIEAFWVMSELVVVVAQQGVHRRLPLGVGEFEDVGMLVQRLVVLAGPGAGGDVRRASALKGDALQARRPLLRGAARGGSAGLCPLRIDVAEDAAPQFLRAARRGQQAALSPRAGLFEKLIGRIGALLRRALLEPLAHFLVLRVLCPVLKSPMGAAERGILLHHAIKDGIELLALLKGQRA